MGSRGSKPPASTFIRDGLVLTQNGLEKRNILIEDGRIAEVAKGTKRAEETVDAKHRIVIPGLANAHTHAFMSLLRGYGDDMVFHDWLFKKMWPAEAKMKKEHYYWGTMLSCMEMLRHGVTFFSDTPREHAEEAFKAADDSGIRASIGASLIESDGGMKRQLKAMRDSAGFARGIVSANVCPHTIYTASGELIREAKAFARKEKLPFHIHASETRKEVFDCLEKTGKRPVEYLDSLGAIDSSTMLVHMGWCTSREIRIAGKAGASVAFCPVSNMKLATGGLCQAIELDSEGANVAIGTDGVASNNSYNMFEEMKFAAITQKNFYWRGDAISARKVFGFGTANGYKAFGLDGGRVGKGALADLVMLDAKAPNLNPVHDIYSNLVYAAHPGNVTDVFVAGRHLLERGKFAHIDSDEVMDKVSGLASFD
ncbi:MAG: amidohydrolase [Candidatus Bilamarchaeaceae archaeon]